MSLARAIVHHARPLVVGSSGWALFASLVAAAPASAASTGLPPAASPVGVPGAAVAPPLAPSREGGAGSGNPTGGVPPARAVDGSYTIHPGDTLNVQVFGEQSLTQPVTVLPDGSIDYPLVGQVMVAGKTPNEAAAALAAALRRYLRHPNVSVAVAKEGTLNVLVLGDVKTPGKYQVRTNARVTDAIAAAGGLNPVNGAFPNARLATSSGAVHQLSLQKLLHDGDLTLNEPLTDGEVVYVPGPQTITVNVLGAVDHPGDIAVNEGDRLSMAIAKAGNSPNTHADLNRIVLTRQVGDGKTEHYTVDLYKAIEKGDMRADLPLQKGDVVWVPEAKSHQALSTGLGLLRLLIGL